MDCNSSIMQKPIIAKSLTNRNQTRIPLSAQGDRNNKFHLILCVKLVTSANSAFIAHEPRGLKLSKELETLSITEAWQRTFSIVLN